MELLHRVAEVDHDRVQRRAGGRIGPPAGRLDHEVEQHRIPARRRDEHVAAGAQAGQQRLGHERGEQRGERGVDGVAAGAQDAGPGLGGQRVAGRDDAPAGHPHRSPTRQNLGMNSGTSTSMVLREAARTGSRLRVIRGSPTGSRNGSRSRADGLDSP